MAVPRDGWLLGLLALWLHITAFEWFTDPKVRKRAEARHQAEMALWPTIEGYPPRTVKSPDAVWITADARRPDTAALLTILGCQIGVASATGLPSGSAR